MDDSSSSESKETGDAISAAAANSVAAANRRRKTKPRGRLISEKQLVDAFSVAFEVSGQGNSDLDSNTLGLMLAIGGLDEDVNKLFDSGILRTEQPTDRYSTRKVAPGELLRWLRLYGKRWFQKRFEILLGEMERRALAERRMKREAPVAEAH